MICTMSCKEALIELVPVFEREKGYAVDVTYGAGPELAKKISGGVAARTFSSGPRNSPDRSSKKAVSSAAVAPHSRTPAPYSP